MTGKFHINSNNESQPCRATVRSCRFGEDSHFENETDARAESEIRLKQEFGEVQSLKKQPTKLKNNVEKSSAYKIKVSNKKKLPLSAKKSIDQKVKTAVSVKVEKPKIQLIETSAKQLIALPEAHYSEIEISAIRDYRAGANWTINRKLREGVIPPGKAGEVTKTLDTLIKNSPTITIPTMVQRSLDTEGGASVNIPTVGKIYSDPSFLSTSINEKYIEETLKKGVDEYSDNPSDTILSIELPVGAKAFALPNEDSDYIDEAEVMLPRNATMVIIEDSGFINGVRRVRGRVLV